MRNVVVLAGGVGGSRFVKGLVAELERRQPDPDERPSVSVVANTGDDVWIAGLRVCPDLDSLMYALAGVNDDARGWGRADETERVATELAAYGVGWPWYTLGDLDLATHIARTALLRDGLTLTEVTARLTARWHAGLGLPATLLPASDDPVETHVRVSVDGAEQLIHFEEWWVRYRAGLPASAFVQVGLETARATDAATAAIRAADVVLLAPSNPVVSIGTILAVPGVREALAASAARVVGVSPIIAGSPVRGMADTCLEVIGVETSAAAVAAHYGARSAGGILDAWLVAEEDEAAVAEVEALGIRCRAVPLWMRDADTAAALAAAAVDAAG